MRNKNLAGAEALRVSVFMPDLDATAAFRASRYVGTQYDLSLILRHNGTHRMPGGRVEMRQCYEIYMHDEVTPGGILVADSCQLPEYFLDEVTLDGEVITLVMNDGTEFTVDLAPLLAAFRVTASRDTSGVWSMWQGDPSAETLFAQFVEGSTYARDDAAQTITIFAPDGNEYVISSAVWDFTYDDATGLFRVYLGGVEYLSFLNVDTNTVTEVVYDEVGQFYEATHSEGPPDVRWYPVFANEVLEGVYNITVFNPDGTPVSFVVEGSDPSVPGEQIVVLNNPVIYVDRDLGVENPPINTQADLTPANAFNSFDAVRNFMTRTLVVGTVTLDCRGDFSAPGYTSAMEISPLTMKNAQIIVVRGQAGDLGAFKLPFGGSTSGRQLGIRCNGGTLVVQDVTFVAIDEALSAGLSVVTACSCISGLMQLAGTVVFEGYYNVDRAGASPCVCFNIQPSSAIEISANATLRFNFDPTTLLESIVNTAPQATFVIDGNVTFDYQAAFGLTDSMFNIRPGSLLRALVSPGNPNPLLVTGGQRVLTPVSARVRDLGIASTAAAYGNRAAAIAYDWGGETSLGGPVATMLIANVAVLNNTVGP